MDDRPKSAWPGLVKYEYIPPIQTDDELRLLRAFWNQYWNHTGHGDPGDGGENATITWAEVTALDDLASAVEDHYIEHGFPEGTF